MHAAALLLLTLATPSSAACDELELSVLQCARAHASSDSLARCTNAAGPALSRCRASTKPASSASLLQLPPAPSSSSDAAAAERVKRRFSYADAVVAGEQPLVLAKLRVTSPFGPRRDPITRRRAWHGGVDLACREGQLLASPVNGIVSESRCGADGRGCYVTIAYGKQRTVSLFHLARPPLVPVGAWLRKNVDVAGVCSSTGRSTGPHAHVEERDAAGRRVDPRTTVLRR